MDRKENKNQAENKPKQFIRLPLITMLLKKRTDKQLIPESEIGKKLKIIN